MNARLSLLLFAIFVSLTALAQIKNPVQWTYAPSSNAVALGSEVELIFKASIQSGWHLYTTEFPCEDGPIKAAFTFAPHASFKPAGAPLSVNPVSGHDDAFDCDVKYFNNTGEFRQKIKALSLPLKVTGELEYQVCSETDGQCIPGTLNFTFDKWTAASSASGAEKKKDDPASESPSAEEIVSSPVEIQKNQGPIFGKFQQESEEAKSAWLGFFILSFFAGLAALLTPCVFPMIPMTVSFFTERGTKTQALFYGFSIVLIYTVVGALLAPLMGPETANDLSTEWIPNLIFFLVFIIFGLSFLGLFEITLPNAFINKVDKQSTKGGWIGIFFMAFTLVLVSFSCTGPLVGSILVSAAGGEIIKPIIGMLGFSLAFAIPFTLFAFFPNWLRSLPKSGGWLNTVKVVLGFLEIALAFKFLSIADQAFHWRILDREVNIAIWIVLVGLIGVYLMKGFKMPSDSDNGDKKLSVFRVLLAACAFTFTVYLIPGLWGAPLKSLSGYLPPMYTHDFDIPSQLNISRPNEICATPKHSEFLHIPHGIRGYFDYDEAIACARQQKKPLFIDFTGHGCTNCREMEARVWSHPTVLQRLKNDFIVVALYVDDKTELPKEKWYTSTYDSKVKKTIGKQNADLQIRRLNNNAQPFYVLVGLDERVLLPPKTYDLSPEHFANYLETGKAIFREWYK